MNRRAGALAGTHPHPRSARAAGVALLASGLVLASCTRSAPSGAGTTPTPADRASTAPALPTSSGSYNPNSDPVVEVVRRVEPAVVNVTTKVLGQSLIFGGSPQTGSDVGTGFVVRSDGIIVTNYHVVEGALNIRVTFNGSAGRFANKVYQARVIGGDSAHDLAVLKVGASGLPTVPMGDSNAVLLGEPVVALGYALALPGGPTVTEGIISSLARTIQVQDPNAPNGPITRTYQDALQTDAAINPGNSGGPLVDLNGSVIGINTAGTQSAQNIGFAIAIDAARPIIEQAIEHPRAPVAYMGVVTETVSPGIAGQFGLSVQSGALVVALSPSGPAERAGIRVGDIIVAFGGQRVTGADQLGTLIQSRRPGEHVRVGLVTQGGRSQTVTVTLGDRPLP